uniref:Ig-like domain-containing protein n=1 Tax=Xiphophorus maculatus TaxID=8083 RepID=A0A3B5RAW4_XIPMA
MIYLINPLGAPVFFKKELKSQDAIEGDDITLQCEVSKPGVRVEWRKGGIVLQPGKKYEMKQEGRIQELCIHSLEPEDSGYYTCDAGEQLTTASLAVQGSLHAVPSTSVLIVYCLFDCVVIGKPPPTVRWYKDGKLLEENDHYMINEDQEGCHQLIITSVLPTDMGVYRCTAENSSGIAATKAELRVDSK